MYERRNVNSLPNTKEDRRQPYEVRALVSRAAHLTSVRCAVLVECTYRLVTANSAAAK